MDLEKVRAIKEWPLPRSMFEVRSFHGLVSFYRKFIIDFSGICAPMMDTVKKRHKYFKWIEELQYTKGENHRTTNSGLTKLWKDISSEM